MTLNDVKVKNEVIRKNPKDLNKNISEYDIAQMIFEKIENDMDNYHISYLCAKDRVLTLLSELVDDCNDNL